MTLVRPSINVVMLLLVIPTLTSVASAQDAVRADPQHYKVVLENEQVRVLRVKFGSGEKSPMHAHPAHVAVYLTGGQFRFTFPDRPVISDNGQVGTVGWMAGDTKHAPENIGSEPIELILVEVKRGGSPNYKPFTLDPVKVDSTYQIVLDNKDVRVLRRRTAGAVKGVEHEHPSHVMIRVAGEGPTMKPGDVVWVQGPLKHGTREALPREIVIVELKSTPAVGSH